MRASARMPFTVISIRTRHVSALSDAEKQTFRPRIGTLEQSKKSRLVRGINPNSVIGDPKANSLSALFSSNINLRDCAGGNKFHGIPQKIRQCLGEGGFMRKNFPERRMNIYSRTWRLHLGITFDDILKQGFHVCIPRSSSPRPSQPPF